MARSIHTTRRTLVELRRQNFSSPEDKLSAFARVEEALGQKRRIKKHVSRERHQPEPPLAGTAIESIPLEVFDESPFVHHGASPADIRAILAALPAAATEGIAKIQLCLGKEQMEEETMDFGEDRDPFTGRRSCERFSGVFNGPLRGTYSDTGLISIYAFVYDPAHLPLPRSLCEFYLRLRALKTFVHEVAHHHDQVARIARGRWRSDRKYTFEWYAEKMGREWTQNIVLPYLKSAYPKEALALRKWVAHRGGLKVGLSFFADNAIRTERKGEEYFVFTKSAAFERWVDDIANCESLTDSRLAFAWELHCLNAYHDCLNILDAILAKEHGLIPVLTCKADTLVHLERFDEALCIAEIILRYEPANPEAWEIRGDIYESKKDWIKLLEHCAKWQQLVPLKRVFARNLHRHRATAHCALGNDPAMEESIAAYLALFNFRSEKSAKWHRAHVLRRVFRMAGKPLPAK